MAALATVRIVVTEATEVTCTLVTVVVTTLVAGARPAEVVASLSGSVVVVVASVVPDELTMTTTALVDEIVETVEELCAGETVVVVVETGMNGPAVRIRVPETSAVTVIVVRDVDFATDAVAIDMLEQTAASVKVHRALFKIERASSDAVAVAAVAGT